ncbi:ABC transporter substrate-binding protein [Roseivivax halodurans JCM 10272]|uniref:ABC transporter substrate-binding protein n=1 Tax=Roseivivax halodurans JCM 10272 TaxID=1449350 RepID=X7EB66_9RHOB|nr:sugar ABC transporter substrate-binding protein [Roseivivax halodurans]ETX13202.1 ABC transporter substrate-binding protein [Roseivivax halodurans JCM 10272]
MIQRTFAAASAAALATATLGTAVAAQQATVGFLMPDQASTRYEERDYPGFRDAMAELCADCEVVYQNANADAQLQQQQFNSLIAQGASVIVLDPVDSSAAASLVNQANAQDVRVIAYDRPIPDVPADFYVSFDNVGIGRAIAQSLVDHLQSEDVSEGSGVLQVNGSPTDAAAGLIRDGIDEALDGSAYETLAEFDTPNWAPPEAQRWVAGQIQRFGEEIVGVVAANDGTAGGTIAAFSAAGTDPIPPVTGNDATIAALQRIIAGTQYNTISKPSEIVAEAAASIAYAFISGETPAAETTLYDTPSQLFTPEVVTRENIVEIIFDGGINTPEEICTAEFEEGCRELGIIE